MAGNGFFSFHYGLKSHCNDLNTHYLSSSKAQLHLPSPKLLEMKIIPCNSMLFFSPLHISQNYNFHLTFQNQVFYFILTSLKSMIALAISFPRKRNFILTFAM